MAESDSKTPEWANYFAASIESALFEAKNQTETTTNRAGAFLVQAAIKDIDLVSLERDHQAGVTTYTAERTYPDESDTTRRLKIAVIALNDGTIKVVAKDGPDGEELAEIDPNDDVVEADARYVIELLQ